MRILHICDSLNPAGIGGYESYLHYLSKEMTKRGHISKIVTQSPSTDRVGIEVQEHYDVHYLPGNFLEARKWEFLSLPEDEREEAAGEMFTEDDIERCVNILCEQLLTAIENYSPTIIHAHSTYVIFNKVLKRLRESKSISQPLILTIHGLPKPLILPGSIYTTDYRELNAHCIVDIVLGVSDTVTNALRSELYPIFRGEIRTLYLGIDTDVFRPIENVEKRWDVAFMGRLEHMKSVDLFPSVLKILRSTHPNLKMMITGEGSLREKLFHDLEKNELREMVEYLGVVPYERVPELLNASRVFLYPSRREPFGLSIIEAMACSVPVVTSNLYGPREIVAHSYNGMSVNPEDPIQISDAIKSILDNSNLRDSLSHNGLNTVKKRYEMRKHADALMKIYGN